MLAGIEMNKMCSTCGVTKDISKFFRHVRYKDGYAAMCKTCKTAKNYAWREKNAEAVKLRNRITARRRYNERKNNVLMAYGGRCIACGINDMDVLTVDHINNDGADHRRELVGNDLHTYGSSYIYRYLVKNNYPNGFQVLCFNCNFKKHLTNIRNI